jgi:hypothetical protein
LPATDRAIGADAGDFPCPGNAGTANLCLGRSQVQPQAEKAAKRKTALNSAAQEIPTAWPSLHADH